MRPRTSPTGLSRFQAVYAAGLIVAAVAEATCLADWPHNTDGLDPAKAQLYFALRLVGGTACALLLLAVARLVRSRSARASYPLWLLVFGNLFVAWPVLLPGPFQ